MRLVPRDNIVDEFAKICEPLFESWLTPEYTPIIATISHSSIPEPAIALRSGGVDERDNSDEFSSTPEKYW